VRVFLDTNVLVSAFVSRGLCADLLKAVLAQHELVLGSVVRDELRRVLEVKLGVPVEIVNEALAVLEDAAVVTRPDLPARASISDVDDLWVLACAEAGLAEVLVSGDAELIQLAEWSGIPIKSPRAFWDLLRATDD
jgi:putative PIN family toxin of toxin-antitoxin system